EPGALYFQPGAVEWAGGLDQPVNNVAATGWFEKLASGATPRGIEVSAWTVFFHNSSLGSRYPDLVVENAFGDKYPFALCPSQARVQGHAVALCRSLAALGVFAGIDLETIGYLGYSHGYHHEVTAVPLGIAERFLLSLCFCPACRAAGEGAGIEMQTLAGEVCCLLRHRMRFDDAGIGASNAENLTTLLATRPALERLVRLRMDTVTALVNRLARERGTAKLAVFTSSFVGSPSNIWMEGVSPADLQPMVECFHLLAYGAEASDANSDLAFFLSMVEDPGLLNLTLNLGLPVTTTLDQAAAKVEYARRKGIRRFSFFNYGLLGESRLQWIQELACLARKASA
ncbi:MAG TPA: hypothetical protein VEU11_02895, partial [Terriglobales bacterium]|nr:hypothetical protein [Terriglobales bacterium]